MIRAWFLLISLLLFAGSGTAQQYTYSQSQAVSKGALAIETNGINIGGGTDFISFGAGGLAPNDTQSGFYVNVSTGEGGYYPPRFYPVPALPGSLNAATGDFDRDGKVDVVVTNGSGDVYLFRGNQSPLAGYFDQPKSYPLGVTNASLLGGVATADFNRDGKLDLVFGTEDDLVVAYGNGDGTFQTIDVVYYVSAGARVMAGDFNGDARADIAVASVDCGDTCFTHLQFVFSNPSDGFSVAPVIDFNRAIDFQRVVDLDKDGRSDLIGVSASASDSIVRLLKGRSDRTFTIQDVPLAKNAFPGTATVDVSDVNADGKNDLVVVESDNTTRYVGLLYGADGGFSPEQWVFTDPRVQAVLTSRYNTGTKPDIVVRTSDSEFGPGTLHILKNTLNLDAFPDCDVQSDPPSGIRVCVPQISGAYPPDIRFSIGAAFTSPLRRIEVWVDGAKRAEGFNSYDQYSFLDTYINVAGGQHTASIYAVSFDGLKLNKKVAFTVTSGTGCPAPLSVGITICSPGTTSGSPVKVNATGTTSTTTVRMELWVDGTKRASVGGNNLQTSISLPAGTHRFSFYAIDSSGSKVNVVRKVTVN
jgi:hypothetical protein